MGSLDLDELDFGNAEQMDALIEALDGVLAEDALAWLDQSIGSRLVRRNISKSPEYAVDKPKLDIMPVWVPAKTANGHATTVEYRDDDGNVVDTRDKVKPLFVTYTEEQEPNVSAGITRSGSDIITAVSMDDGATWKRFNVSHMARKSSFTLETGEKFPGNSRGPRQKIVDDKIMVIWTSAYARGGKPSFAIKTDDDYPHDDAYAVNDVWGVRGRQGSVELRRGQGRGRPGHRRDPLLRPVGLPRRARLGRQRRQLPRPRDRRRRLVQAGTADLGPSGRILRRCCTAPGTPALRSPGRKTRAGCSRAAARAAATGGAARRSTRRPTSGTASSRSRTSS